MADLAAPTSLNVVESLEQMTLPAAEAIVMGAPVRIDTVSGRFTNANATVAAEARAYGVAVRTAIAGVPVTAVKKGVLDMGDIFDGLGYDADVFLSDNEGVLADAAGTVNKVVGKVVPGLNVTLGTANDKMLLVDL
jgi:TPP-dependent indolepyruvate ferredoxin oxidoreductase alpha subunit